MIFDDNPAQSFDSRIIDTVNYLKYCRHKARNLSSADSATLLRHCLVNRILRMPDNNKKNIIDAIRQNLHPKRNFSKLRTSSQTTPVDATNRPLLLVHKNDSANTVSTPPRPDAVSDFNDDAVAGPLHTILELFYGASAQFEHNSTQSNPTHAHISESKKIENVISCLRLLVNRLEDTTYRLIDILPQLGEVFAAKEDVTQHVLAQTIDHMFNIFNIEKFSDVKFNTKINTKVKQKAFLFDLLSQDFHRLKSQQEKGVYLDQALKRYREELKGLI